MHDTPPFLQQNSDVKLEKAYIDEGSGVLKNFDHDVHGQANGLKYVHYVLLLILATSQ